jgi:hypothetical protein
VKWLGSEGSAIEKKRSTYDPLEYRRKRRRGLQRGADRDVDRLGDQRRLEPARRGNLDNR